MATSYWTADKFGPDQEAYYYDAGSLDVNLGNLRLFVRLTDPDADGGWNGYQLINHRLITGCYWYLWRLDDGATTSLANQVPTNCWPYFLFRAVGSSIQAFGSYNKVDWTPVVDYVDSTYAGPGRIGLGIESGARSSTSSAAAR